MLSKNIEQVKQQLRKDISKPLACGDIIVCSIEDVETILQYTENLENKLEQTEDDETTINLLYQEVDLLKAEINQLETQKQKLIEKLEEKISFNKSFNDCTYCNNTCNSYATCKFAQKILEILKGEKE